MVSKVVLRRLAQALLVVTVVGLVRVEDCGFMTAHMSNLYNSSQICAAPSESEERSQSGNMVRKQKVKQNRRMNMIISAHHHKIRFT